jgi:outer membrane protein assembly factor BamB
MRLSAKIACVGAIAILTGCTSISHLFRADTRNPPAPLVDFKPSMNVHTAWSSSVGDSGNYVFSPALSDGNLFLASADGTMVRLDPATGRVVWRVSAGMPLTAGVGIDVHTIAVAGEKGAVLAFDHDGKLRWKAQASSEILSSPAVGQGLVIIRSGDDRIQAFDAESGEMKWSIQRAAPPLTLRITPGIVIDGPAAFAALPGGKLLAIALNNGAPGWEATVGEPRGTTELERVTDTAGTPVVSGSDICAVAYQGRVACFDVSSGEPRWAKKLSSDVGVSVDERFVYAADDAGGVNAFSRDAGTSVWRNKTLTYRRLTAPVPFNRAVAVGDAEGYVHFLSREDGAMLARTATGSSPIVGTPVAVGSNIIIQTQSGAVVALTTE